MELIKLQITQLYRHIGVDIKILKDTFLFLKIAVGGRIN